MNNIIFFLNELSLYSGAIWLENDTIKLSTPKKLQTEETKNFIISNKGQITSILHENDIFSKERFLNVVIFRDNISDYYPLSLAQERLWFIEQFEQGSNAYHIPSVYQLDSDAETAGIKYALQQVVSRHEILRTTIEQDEKEQHLLQRVHDEPLLFQEVTLNSKEDFELEIENDINRPFDLSNEYPIRVKFYKITGGNAVGGFEDDSTFLLVNIHHIASDGWSTDIFETEFFAFYEAYQKRDIDFSLLPLEIQYKDYAVWQRAYLNGEVLENQLRYWKDKLAGWQTLELPTDYARPAGIDHSGASLGFTVDRETSEKLRALAQKFGVTLHSVMLASINILLSKYTGQQDIVTGCVLANRHHRQTENTIGFFVNTQVNRTVLSRTQSFEELIQHVYQEQTEAQQYQDLPFEKLVNALDVERDISRHPVFQVMFEMQDSGDFNNTLNQSEDEETGDEKKIPLRPAHDEIAYQVEKFDLSIVFEEGSDELIGQISYATSLFHENTIESIIHHYTHLVRQLTATPQQPYAKFSLLDAEDFNKVVYDWNDTDKYFPKNKTIHELFQEQAAKTPDHTSLIYGASSLSYEELNKKSNQLAWHIRKQFEQRTKQLLTPDTLIALYLDKGMEMVIGMLAVLKAGGAYVPMDITSPQQRTDYILEDTKAELILCQRRLCENSHLLLPQNKVIYIDLREELYKAEEVANLPQYSQPKDLGYVIYTSGTTGQPKGVMIEQVSIISLVYSDFMKPSSADVFAFLSSPVFDAATFEVWTPLLNGSLLVIPENLKTLASDINEFNKFITLNYVSVLWLTKSFFESLYHFDNTIFKTLDYLIIGGEALDRSVINKLINSHAKPKHFLNGYGPTESTVFTCIYNLSDEILSSNVPIGSPISGRTVFMVDMNNNPVPVGVIGELCIGGAGLARGYLNHPALTEERFISNPFATGADRLNGYTRIYKTGDLVRWQPDGNLEYFGRNDNQVKVRGFRIDLGEIEYALSQIGAINQSCVVVNETRTETGSNKYLVAYYVSNNSNGVVNQNYIIDKLSQSLPEYMVPGILVKMESFPLTANGKLDKRALPKPDFNNGSQHIKPVTELEIKLCLIYATVLGLGIEQISTTQNFFRMGGNSILTMQLKVKLRQLDEFKQISVADLFKYNSINKLIQAIQKDYQTEYKFQKNIAQTNGNHEVAIIGISGAFSGANNMDEFWQLLINQQEGIEYYSTEECLQLGVNEALLQDPGYIAAAGKVKDIELFDPLFWGLSPNEAKLMDPQIRKFIEHCWFALEASGYSNQRKNYHIGVFAGSGNSDYFNEHILLGKMAEQINMWEASMANSKDALATKTAFLLNLTGPANSINTACSTGLVSVVEACRHLQLGTCNMALAGGVSLSMPDKFGYIYEEGMISSSDGHCRTFDIDASGTIVGSGVGVVLLKRLDDAVKDGDTILGVIKGFVTNNDGARKTGYSAPSLIGQTECIINAQSMAGVSADGIEYVECHGTGTNLGDPIEVQALKEAFEYHQIRPGRSKKKTVLGAVKANIGHADSAAGTAGLLKVVAMLQHNMIPGQVNFVTANPELHLDQTNFEIINENRPWLPYADKQRLAAVSSFGIGGTNAHVIIGDHVAPLYHKHKSGEQKSISTKQEQNEPLQYIIPITAKSRKSLESYKQALTKYVSPGNNGHRFSIRDIAYTLQERREHFNFRSAYAVRNTNELINKLTGVTSYAETNTEESNKVVFMFPGQGVQYRQMAKGLYDNEPFFRITVDQCISIANQHLPIDLYEVMYPRNEFSAYDINETQWTQVSLFIVEYALAKYLEHIGVKGDAYIGHSIGEYVAATLSGVFDIKDAIKIVIARGSLMQSMEPGSMLLINSKEETIGFLIKKYDCEIAVINSPEDIVISGGHNDIDTLWQALDKQEMQAIKLNTSHAYHSNMMERAAQDFKTAFRDIKLYKPKKDFISNVTGEIAGEEVTTPGYWSRQLRNTVQFAKGIERISKQYNHQVTFIEVGVGGGLCSFVNKYKSSVANRSIQTVQLLPSAKEALDMEEKATTYRNISTGDDLKATLWMNGILPEANDPAMFKQAILQTGLPPYQFDFQKCWLESSDENILTHQPELLSKESWLSTPVWSAICNLDNYLNNDAGIFKNALVFLRADQLNSLDFNMLAANIQYVVLDTRVSNIDNMDASGIIRIDPGNEIHFKTLEEFFKTKGNVFDTIIHMSSINNVADFDESLHYSFYSLFLVSRQFLNAPGLENLFVFTNGLSQITNEDVVHAANGTLVGAIRNINHEFQNIDARIIDIGHNSMNVSAYIMQAIDNIAYKKAEGLMAIRFGKLWMQNFEMIGNSLTKNEIIREGDIILITGGLGGIALSHAQHISGQHNVTFILVSRKNIYDEEYPTEYTQEKNEIIEGIKANGSSVAIICADISNKKQIGDLLNKVREEYGTISGIIHTAGVSPLSPEDYNVENIKSVFKGKVYGVDNIITSIDLNHLRFIASSSSLASVMGDINRIEYCAANSYLDYLSADKLRFKNTKIISINWPGWSDIGMVKNNSFYAETDEEPIDTLQRLMDLNSVSHLEGSAIFYQLINQTKYDQVIVSKLDIPMLKERLFKQIESNAACQEIRLLEENYTDTEYQIAKIFGEVLGVEEISVHDDFFRLGGNSIHATHVSHLISKLLNCNVFVSDLFRHKTIHNLKDMVLMQPGNDKIKGKVIEI